MFFSTLGVFLMYFKGAFMKSMCRMSVVVLLDSLSANQNNSILFAIRKCLLNGSSFAIPGARRFEL